MHSKNLFSSTSKLYQQIRDDIRKNLKKDSQQYQESLRVRAEQIKKESLLSTFIIDNLIHDSQNKKSSLTNNPSESNKHELTLKEFKNAIKNLSVKQCEILIRIKKETNKPLDYIPWNTTDLFAESGKQLKKKRSASYCRSKNNLEKRKLIIFCEKDKRKYYIALTDLGFLIAECIENLNISKPILNKFKKYLAKELPSKISFDTLKSTLEKCRHLLENV